MAVTWLKKVAVKRAKTSHGKSRSVSDEEKNMKRWHQVELVIEEIPVSYDFVLRYEGQRDESGKRRQGDVMTIGQKSIHQMTTGLKS
jgi:hypothetical protein